VPFYRQIVDQVAALVRSEQLAPGSLLPSARDLAATLMVSLITVRRAYADLEAAGLVVRRQGQGTYVADAVTGAAAEKARSDARSILGDAVTRARQLGLLESEILAEIQNHLTGGSHD